MLCDLISAKGYTNASWMTDESALACLGTAHQYGLLILDMHMPTVSGLDLMRQIRFKNREIYVPVIAMSGDQRYRTVAIKAGACAFLLKPFAIEEVEVAVYKALLIY